MISSELAWYISKKLDNADVQRAIQKLSSIHCTAPELALTSNQ